MHSLRYIVIAGLMMLLSAGCSEERKREAARLAAELEARERGETLSVDSSTLDSLDTAVQEVAGNSDAGSGQTSDTTVEERDLPPEHSIAVPDTAFPEVDTQPSATQPSEPARLMPPIISDGYTVQVESSPVQSYIEQQVEVFKQRGYDAYISAITRPDDQKTYYRLRVGRFATSEEAEALSREINSQFGVSSWVDWTTFGPATPSGEHPR